jgi:hypothetical protein
MNQEIWKRLTNEYEGYSVSNYGNVISHIKKTYHSSIIDYNINKPLKLTIDKVENNEYYKVTLKGVKCRVHRLVAMMFLPDYSDDLMIDHIDGNGLNNHVSNLRMCNKHQNSLNSKKPSNNTSGYKGVCFYDNKWEASVGRGTNRIRKCFNTLEEAIKYRNEMTNKYYSNEFYIEDRLSLST